MADYTSEIYIDDFSPTFTEYTYTETCTASITNTPDTPEMEDTGIECTATIHNHVTGLTPVVAIEAAEIEGTITSTPVTPTHMDILLASTGTIHNHSPSVEVAGSSLAEATIHVYPITPGTSNVITINPSEPLGDPGSIDGTLIKRIEAKVGLSDKMYQGAIEYDKCEQSILDATYFKRVELSIPDYTGTDQLVMLGLFPSSNAEHAADGSSETLIAYDYAWYLTMQYLSDADMVLPSLDDQDITILYRLNYDYCTTPGLDFAEGDIVEGSITGHLGKVIENHFSGAWGRGYLILGEMQGTPIAGHYYQDDENLLVGGVVIAAADGYTMVASSSEAPDLYPDMWVERVLGGDNWEKTTGIYPWRLANTATLWNTVQTTFVFEEKQTKMQAIQDLAKYLNYIFYVRWNQIGIIWTPCAYFIPETEIDDQISEGDLTNGLDLPAKAVIAETDPYVVSPVSYSQKGDEMYNRVTVRCQSLITGEWFTSKQETTGVKNGDDLPIEYYEVNTDIGSQAEADARALDLFTYYSDHIKTWDITLQARSDLRLLQQINFGGFGTKIPSGNYRIVDISYVYENGGVTNETKITVVPLAQFSAYLNISRTFTDSISEVQAIVRDQLNKMGQIEAGTVTAIDGAVVTVMTERGMTKVTRDPSA